tara:strand:- start:54 stop:317 length:264 start_codon:yes stop_codon:yes gene_type:complete
MKFEELSIKNSLLWFLIAIFLFFWLGNQLLGAVTNLEIENLRVTNMVSLNSSPIWFIFIVGFKSIAWIFSILVIYKYAKSKLSSQNT